MELKVVFRNNIHNKLIGKLLIPKNADSLGIGVILCHGFLAHKDFIFFPHIAKGLFDKGIATLRFDCRACGESEGEFHPSYKTMIDDILAAIDFFKQQKGIKKIILLGHSMGGTSVIMAAKRNTSVAGVISCGAVAHPFASIQRKRSLMKNKDGIFTLHFDKKDHLFTDSFFTDAKDVNPLEVIGQLDIPILLIHGTSDKKVSDTEAKELFNHAPGQKELFLIPSANHRFKNHEDVLLQKILEFIKNK